MNEEQPIKVRLSWGSMWVIAWGIIMSGVVLAFLATLVSLMFGIGFGMLTGIY